MAILCDAAGEGASQGTAAFPTTGTLAMWFRPGWDHTDGLSHQLFMAGTGTQYINCDKFTDNTIYCGWFNTTDFRVQVLSANYTITNGAWTHLCMTWTNGGATELFLNGISRGTNAGPLSAFSTSGSTRFIGTNTVGTSNSLSRISHWSVWGRVLDGTQIAALQRFYPNHPAVGPIGTDWVTFIGGDLANRWGGASASLLTTTTVVETEPPISGTNRRVRFNKRGVS